MRDYELDDHHVHLLTLAAEALDRAHEARVALKREGLTFTDRFGSPKIRPEAAVERDSRLSFARLLRELGLDAAGDPEAPRLPGLHNGRRK